jgi:hypothetical protein
MTRDEEMTPCRLGFTLTERLYFFWIKSLPWERVPFKWVINLCIWRLPIKTTCWPFFQDNWIFFRQDVPKNPLRPFLFTATHFLLQPSAIYYFSPTPLLPLLALSIIYFHFFPLLCVTLQLTLPVIPLCQNNPPSWRTWRVPVRCPGRLRLD